MESLAEEIQRIYGTVVNVRDDGRAKPLDHTVSSRLYRAVRELLINVAKHAKVGVAGVEITSGDDQICIVVTDQGVGFDFSNMGASRDGKGFGLVSIRERIVRVGGAINVYSAAGDAPASRSVHPCMRRSKTTRLPRDEHSCFSYRRSPHGR
jgi:signal transduction histidine kinase